MKKLLLMSLLLSAAGLFAAAEPTQAGPAPIGQGEGKEEVEEKESAVVTKKGKGKKKEGRTEEEKELLKWMHQEGRDLRAEDAGLSPKELEERGGIGVLAKSGALDPLAQMVMGFAQPLRWNINFAPGEVSKVIPEISMGKMVNPMTIHASPDGHYLAIRGSDNKFVIWDMQEMRPVSTIPLKFVLCVAFLPGTDQFAIADDEGIQFFDVTSGQMVREIKIPSMGAREMSFSPDGRYAVYLAGKVMIIHDLQRRSSVRKVQFLDMNPPVFGAEADLSSDAQQLAVFSTNHQFISIYDVQTRRMVLALSLGEERGTQGQYTLLLDAEASRVGVGAWDSREHFFMWWDARTGERLGKIAFGRDLDLIFYGNQFAFSPDGQHLVDIFEGTIRFWNLPELERQYREQKELEELPPLEPVDDDGGQAGDGGEAKLEAEVEAPVVPALEMPIGGIRKRLEEKQKSKRKKSGISTIAFMKAVNDELTDDQFKIVNSRINEVAQDGMIDVGVGNAIVEEVLRDFPAEAQEASIY